MMNAIAKRALLLALTGALAGPAACSSGGDGGGGEEEGGGGKGGKGGNAGKGGGGKGGGAGGGESAGAPGGGSSGSGPPGGGAGGDNGGAAGDGGGTAGAGGDTGPIPMGKCLTGTPTGYAFGAHPMKYPTGTARPSGDQKCIDGQVTAFFDVWKKAYLKNDCPGGYYLFSNGGAGTGGDTFLTTSEAHGYAMIIFALMNGYDPQAHEIFDGLLDMMKKFPSINTPAFMAWGIDKGCKPVMGNDSASDGDIDMAYALLLADKVWGSAGKNNYLQLATAMMVALKVADMNSETHLPKLGDWVTRDQSNYYYTRPSDFMLDHYRAFAKASNNDPDWLATVTSIYNLVDYMQAKYAPVTGLIPDFIMKTNTPAPEPVPLAITNEKGGLEEDLHSDYDYNSCRVPWRLGTDYIVTGDPKVKARLAKINAFIQKATGGDPANVIDGYSFAGEPWKGKPAMGTMAAQMAGENGCFTASFGTGAMVDAANQKWVDAVWKYIQTTGLEGDEYTASVKLLNMLVMSGNWWAP